MILNISLLGAFYLRYGSLNKAASERYLLIIFGLNVSWVVIARINKLYQFSRITPWSQIAIKYVKVNLFEILLFLAVSVAFKASFLSREFVFYLLVLIVFQQLAVSYLTHRALIFVRQRGQNYRNVAVLGITKASRDFVGNVLNEPRYGFRFKGYYGIESSLEAKSWNDFKESAVDQRINELICSLAIVDELGVDEVLAFCGKNRIRVRFLSDVLTQLRKSENAKIELVDFYSIPLLVLRPEPLADVQNRVLKRAFDIVFSLILLFGLVIWLFPICVLMIKLSSKGPVIFRQNRRGINGRVFTCLKFRTMRVDSGEKQASHGRDSRTYWFGHLLRASHIDELPQVFNVLKGEMSIVGPRPHMMWQDEFYNDELNNYSVRQFVKPGITGLAQSKGYHGETKDIELMKRRVELDLYYIQNWSMWLDVSVLGSTLRGSLMGWRIRK